MVLFRYVGVVKWERSAATKALRISIEADGRNLSTTIISRRDGEILSFHRRIFRKRYVQHQTVPLRPESAPSAARRPPDAVSRLSNQSSRVTVVSRENTMKTTFIREKQGQYSFPKKKKSKLIPVRYTCVPRDVALCDVAQSTAQIKYLPVNKAAPENTYGAQNYT
ncbi:hypothetical protein EVAR_92519_1 [Eumeta japonica]|uniref:Uncharacterized protein n=1 Tax=Eumeta variegata TaxID=151549 RepID=A0A4C1T9A1_EUMVA|nr:hypothetical protein EVAR_92519_1 [Eumeta japonica]